MKRYYVEFDNHDGQRVIFYIYAKSPSEVKEMLDYDLIACDQTD
jgi:hypothetical protein